MITKLKSLLLYFLAGTGLVFWLISIYGILRSNEDQTKVYNCEYAEISPDFPPEVRNECRRLRSGQRI